MFVWSKRPGEPRRTKFYWGPLILSVVASVLLTLLLNAVL